MNFLFYNKYLDDETKETKYTCLNLDKCDNKLEDFSKLHDGFLICKGIFYGNLFHINISDSEIFVETMSKKKFYFKRSLRKNSFILYKIEYSEHSLINENGITQFKIFD